MINLQNDITLKHNVDITITYFEDLYKVDKPQLVKTSYQDFIRVLSQPKTFASKASAGGFVGGPVINRRENANVQNRTLLTFDLDDCPPHFDLYQHMIDHFGVAFVMYSSHRHTGQAPKYRLIIPVTEPIPAEKYRPLQEKLITVIGFKNKTYTDNPADDDVLVDNASTVLSQHMHMPTVPDDGSTYVFKYHDAPILDTNVVLKYVNDVPKKRGNYTPNDTNHWIRLLDGVGDGERNTTATSLCGHLLRRYIDPELVYSILLMWNERNNPPLDEKELNRTFDSIMKKEIRRREQQYN